MGTAPEALLSYTLTEIVSAAGQTEIIAAVDHLKDSIFGTSGGAAGSAGGTAWPDADQISPQLRDRIIIEIDALTAAIEAMPTA